MLSCLLDYYLFSFLRKTEIKTEEVVFWWAIHENTSFGKTRSVCFLPEPSIVAVLKTATCEKKPFNQNRGRWLQIYTPVGTYIMKFYFVRFVENIVSFLLLEKSLSFVQQGPAHVFLPTTYSSL